MALIQEDLDNIEHSEQLLKQAEKSFERHIGQLNYLLRKRVFKSTDMADNDELKGVYSPLKEARK